MRVFLDDQRIDIPGPAQAGSVAAAISAARSTANASGRVIVDILVDGERLDEEALESPSTKPAGDIELKCFSADPRQLVAESFADVSRALTDARTVQKEAAAALQTGRLDAAFDGLSSVLEVWDAVHRVTEQGPALLGVPLSAIAGDSSIQKDLSDLSATLTQLRSVVANQDWPTLADLLECELDDAAQRWSELLSAFAQRAGVAR